MHLRDGIQTHSTVAQRYAHLVETGEIAGDPAQQPVVAALDRLNDEICAKRLARKSSALGWLFAKNREALAPVKGLYIHGGVGSRQDDADGPVLRHCCRCGASGGCISTPSWPMRMTASRSTGWRARTARRREDDPIPPVARALAEEAWVLCFDEFSVTDIADAMILSRLFSALFANGVVLVATSNVAPDDLYRDGLNRKLFEPFIGMLKRNAEVIGLDSGTDYRLEKLNRMPVYLTPLSPATDARIDEAWEAVTHGDSGRARGH